MGKMSLEEFKATVDRLVKAITTDDDPYNDPTGIMEWNKPIMKTTELIDKLHELNFVTAEIHGNLICIYKRQHGDKIDPLPFYKINVKATELKEGKTEIHREASQGRLTLVAYDKILTLLKAYLATPIEDREEKKKYYLKTASPLVSEQTQYLNYNLETDSYFYSSVYNDEDHIKYIFTQTEIDNMDTTGLIPEPITDIEEEN